MHQSDDIKQNAKFESYFLTGPVYEIHLQILMFSKLSAFLNHGRKPICWEMRIVSHIQWNLSSKHNLV